MKNEEIAVLVGQVQKDKKTHFGLLYKEIWNTVYYYCYKNLGNEQDASDAMQTIFMKLYNTFDSLENPFAFNKFLRTIMTYTCADFHRANYRGETDELENYDEVLEEENKDFLPEEAFEREDVRREITKMIQVLPAKQREAILFFYYDDLSIKEIAEITNSNIPAVKNSLVRARLSLRERADELIKKGAITRTMVILPLPILTRILLWEAEQVATPEIGEATWENICNELGISPTATLSSTATTATTSSTVGINIAIGACAAAVLATGVWFAYYTNENIINPPAIIEYYEDLYETGANMIDFAIIIREIINRTEFDEFVDTYGFRFIGRDWTSETGHQMLYFLEHRNQFIYVGFTEDLQNNFRVVYEITDNDQSRITAEEIPAWFARQS